MFLFLLSSTSATSTAEGCFATGTVLATAEGSARFPVMLIGLLLLRRGGANVRKDDWILGDGTFR